MSESSEEDKVLSLYYQGPSRKVIHDQYPDISTGKISGIIGKEKKRLGTGVVEAIRRIGKEMHRAGITWADISDSFVILQACKKYGLDFEEVKDSLPTVLQRLDMHGLKLSDLPLDIDDKVKKNDEADKRAETLKEELIVLEDEKSKKLKDAGHTEESIAKCRKMTDFLKEYDLSPDAPEKLKNAIENAASLDFDGKAISNKLSTNKSLDSMNTELETGISLKKTAFETLDSDFERRRIEYWKETDAIDALKILKDKNVKSSDILAMKDLVEREGSELPTLSKKVALHGSLDKANVESAKHNEELGTQEAKLEPAVETLKKTKQGLEIVVKDQLETLTKTMQSMKDGANDVVTKISEAGKEASSKISAIGEEAEAVTKRYARTHGVLAFEPLIREANGEKVGVSQLRDAAVLAMTILLSRLPPRAAYSYKLESFMKDFKDDSSLDIFS